MMADVGRWFGKDGRQGLYIVMVRGSAGEAKCELPADGKNAC